MDPIAIDRQGLAVIEGRGSRSEHDVAQCVGGTSRYVDRLVATDGNDRPRLGAKGSGKAVEVIEVVLHVGVSAADHTINDDIAAIGTVVDHRSCEVNVAIGGQASDTGAVVNVKVIAAATLKEHTIVASIPERESGSMSG